MLLHVAFRIWLHILCNKARLILQFLSISAKGFFAFKDMNLRFLLYLKLCFGLIPFI